MYKGGRIGAILFVDNYYKYIIYTSNKMMSSIVDV